MLRWEAEMRIAPCAAVHARACRLNVLRKTCIRYSITCVDHEVWIHVCHRV